MNFLLFEQKKYRKTSKNKLIELNLEEEASLEFVKIILNAQVVSKRSASRF